MDFTAGDGDVAGLIDDQGEHWKADLYVVNADAAAFRGKVFQQPEFREAKLDQ